MDRLPLPEAPLGREASSLVRKLGAARNFCVFLFFVADGRASSRLKSQLSAWLAPRGKGLADLTAATPDDLATGTLRRLFELARLRPADAWRSVAWIDAFGHVGEPEWDGARRWLLMRMNERRGRFENELRGPLVLLLPSGWQRETASLAPDLWHIRLHSAVLSLPTFLPLASPTRSQKPPPIGPAPVSGGLAELPRAVVHWTRLLKDADNDYLDPEALSGLSLGDGVDAVRASRAAGRLDEALALADRLVELAEARADPERSAFLVGIHQVRGDVLADLHRPTDASDAYRSALRLADTLASHGFEEPFPSMSGIWAALKLAGLAIAVPDIEAADLAAETALRFAKRLQTMLGNDRDEKLCLARACDRLAEVRTLQQRPGDALQLYRDSWLAWQVVFNSSIDDAREYVWPMVSTLADMVTVLRSIGQAEEAVPLISKFSASLLQMQELAGGDDPYFLLSYASVQSLSGLLASQGAFGMAAVRAYQEVDTSLRRFQAVEQTSPGLRPVAAALQQRLALARELPLVQRRQYAGDAVAVLGNLVKEDPTSTELRDALDQAEVLLGRLTAEGQ